ncbi:hypothetical protein vseg_007099 [Gypsophila vaccaria]
MNYTTILSMLLSIVLIQLLKMFFHHPKNNKLPPGPKQIPIFGNIFNIGEKPHRSFTNLAKLYGPIISLKLGSVTTIIVSSADVAREMFLKHDHVLSNRTIPNSVKAGNHDKLSMSWLPVSHKWRHLRKIAAMQLFSTQRLDSSQSLRLAKVQQLLEHVQECCNLGLSVDIGRATFTTTLSLLSNTFFSKELAHYSSSKSQEFKQLMWDIMVEIGRPNYVDYFPMLGFMDPCSIRRRLSNYFDKLIGVFQEIIGERLLLKKKSCGGDTTNDVLSTLLNLYEQNELSMDEINHLLVDIFNAGTDTIASTLEWAMAELVKNREMMTKAQIEIENALEKNCQIIQESDISKLPYLQAIIKETLRLHPPTVFLLPRKADEDVELYGYIVPKNAQVLVNLWAIARDEKVWENPEIFNPERFLGRDIDVKGRNFELLPFGAGRRICPGATLAIRMLNLMLANLVNSFNWKLEDGVNPIDLDMNEKFGITLQKVIPLKVIPMPRL